MTKLIAFLFTCLLSVGVSAQDLKLSYGGTTLSSKERNFTNSAQLQKNSKLAAETPGFKVVSYVISILPVKEDLLGPYTIAAGQDLPQNVKTFMAKAAGSKVYLDDIVVQGPDGKKRKSNSYVIACQ